MANMKSSVNIELNINAHMKNLKNISSDLQKAFSGINFGSTTKNASINKYFDNLRKEFDNLEQYSNKGISNTKEMNSVYTSYQNIINILKVLEKEYNKINGTDIKFVPKDSLKDIKAINDAFEDIKESVNDNSKAVEKETQKLKEQKEILKELKQQKKELNSKTLVSEGEYKTKVNTARSAQGKATKALGVVNTAQVAVNNFDGDKRTKQYKELKQALIDAETEYKRLQQEADTAQQAVDKSFTSTQENKLNTEIKKTEESIKSTKSSLTELKTQGKASLQPVIDQLQKMGVEGVETATSVDDIQKILNNLNNKAVEELGKSFEQAGIKIEEMGLALNNDIKPELDNTGNAIQEFEGKTKDLEKVRQRFVQFFSMDNAIRVFTRIVRDAFNTVKELDAAMTETAVVTDYTVTDMWNKLDAYTARANELGATTQGAYETATLYYQQGLNDQETAELSIETMKMARIANMDYAKATDSMTAALRGFNLELNAASAQRVNDVYSKLAAVTASDTQEISTAMEKTASLAHNAGMDLETTATYLSQALETTREAPENIGTAMKTILARFQSLTKDPDLLSPDAQEALDGETVDANNVEAALRKAGIALRDEAGQFRDAKDIMLELNAVWGSLDKNTQRYIATQTAGARQQSRFIAMMQNYGRTQELLSAAQNSAGASQKQFDKTLESMQAKLNKLTNAWNEFTMGIADSTVIKAGVDAITGLLTIVNKLTDSLGDVGGAIARIGLMIGTWKVGKIAVDKVFGGIYDSIAGVTGMLPDSFAKTFWGRILVNKKATQEAFKDVRLTDILANTLKIDRGSSLTKAVTDKIKNIPQIINQKKNGLFKNVSIFKDVFTQGKNLKTNFSNLTEAKVSLSSKQLEVYKNTLYSTGSAAEALTEATGRIATVAADGSVALQGASTATTGLATAMGVALPIILAVGAAFAIFKIKEKLVEDACERAEASIKKYQDTVSETNNNLNNISDVKDDFNKLAQGVDNAGRNIGLSTQEFARYHEIVEQLVAISPSIVESYDVEGNAIINKTTAIQDLIEAENQSLKSAKAAYTTTSNLKDILTNVVEKNKEVAKGTSIGGIHYDKEKQGFVTGASESEIIKKTNNYNEDKLELLNKLEEAQYKLNEAEGKGGDTTTLEKQIDKINEEIDTLDELKGAADEIKANYAEVTDVLNTYASTQSGVNALQQNFTGILSAGIEKIAMSGKTAEEMKADVRDLIKTFQESPEALTEYKDALKEVEEAKKELDNSERDTSAVNKYNKTVTDAYDNMVSAAYKFSGATREAILQAAEGFKSYASVTQRSLSEALNPLQSMQKQAESLTTILDDIKDHDFYSTADGMREVLDTALSAQDVGGKGSKSFWTTAIQYLGTDFLKSVQFNKDKVQAQLTKIQGMTAEGDTGAIAFQNYYQSKLGSSKEGKQYLTKQGGLALNDSNATEIARLMNMSVDTLMALTQKYSQYSGGTGAANGKEVVSSAIDEGVAFQKEGAKKAGIFLEDLAMAAINAGTSIEDASEAWAEGKGIILDSTKDMSSQFKQLGYTTESGKVNGQEVVAQLVAQGKSEEDIENILKETNIKDWDFGTSGDLPTAISDAIMASVVAEDPTANVVQNQVVSRLDTMIAIMGGKDASDAKANEKESNSIIDTLNKATKSKTSAKEETITNANNQKAFLQEENNTLQAAIDAGNLTSEKSKEYQARIEANQEQIEGLTEAINTNQKLVESANKFHANKQEQNIANAEQKAKKEKRKDIIEKIKEWRKGKEENTLGGKAEESRYNEQGGQFAGLTFTEALNEWIANAIKQFKQWNIDGNSLGQKIHEAFENWIDIKVQAVKDWLSRANDIGNTIGQKIRNGFENWIDSIIESIKNGLNDFNDWGNTIGEKIRQAFENWADNLIANGLFGQNDTKTDIRQQDAAAQKNGTTSNVTTEERKVQIKTDIQDGDLEDFEYQLQQLPKEEVTKLISECPNYALLLQYKDNIDSLPKEKRTEVIAAIEDGNFDPNKEPWKTLSDGTEEEKHFAATVTATGQDELDLLANDWASFDTNTKTLTVTTDAPKAKTAVDNLQKSLEDLTTSKDIYLKTHISTDKNSITVAGHTWNIITKANGGNLSGSAAKGAQRGKLGPKGKGGLTLTGELGPELVWEPDKSISYITGANGPEMRDLPGNAVVWPADQTKKIMSSAAKGKNFGSAGFEPFSQNSSNSNSGNDKNKKNKKKDKADDRLYGTLSRIYTLELKLNKALEKREKLLDEYDEFSEGWATTFKDINKYIKNIVKVNQDVISKSLQVIKSKSKLRKDELTKAAGENGVKKSSILKYFKNGQLNQSKYNALAFKGTKSKSEQNILKAVEAYAKGLEDVDKTVQEARDNIEEANKLMRDQLRQAATDLDDALHQVKDALIDQAQRQIDKLSATNEAINNSNEKLINSINKSIEKQRQDRENKKEEDDLESKRAKLAALKRDTSGANAVAIKQLEKEIAEQEESYTDTLIDQKISALEEQNEEAREQRERQINILQSILDFESESGAFWPQAQKILNDALKNESFNSKDSPIWKLLSATTLYGESTFAIKESVMSINKAINESKDNQKENTKKGTKITSGTKVHKVNKKGDSISNEFAISSGEWTKTSTYSEQLKSGKKGEFKTDKYTYHNAYLNDQGQLVYESMTKNKSTTKSPSKTKTKTKKTSKQTAASAYKKAIDTAHAKKTVTAASLKDAFEKGKAANKTKAAVARALATGDGKGGITWAEIVVAAKKLGYSEKTIKTWSPKSSALAKALKKYATGGRVDYTGPAWLDGTPSKPEMVLNPKDTENFIQLKDILRDVMNNSSTINNGGDNYYDINIQVDQLANDYDVEKLTKKIKKEIIKDSNYRNVNTVRRMK